MKKMAMVLIAITILSGCATFGQQMQEGLNAMMGKDARTAFKVLGYPSGKQQFGSDTVYFWSVSRSGALFLPQTSTTYGTVGSTPVYGRTSFTQVVPVNYSCLIKLVADSDDRLINWEYNGNPGGCRNYMNRLQGYIDTIK